MPTVTIDGVPYEPAGQAGNIGIAVTTHNRPDVLAQALDHHRKHLPAGAVLVVVDDGSTPPATVPDDVRLIRLEESQGIVAAKNASLTALMDAGVQHLFLFDDDAWPVVDGWHTRYIDSPEPHLAYQFLDITGPRKLRDLTILHEDTDHIAYSGQRGVMLYYTREAIDRVGGFDPIYGRGMYEHSDLANRIHQAGLTTWRYADITGSDSLIYSLDEHEQVTRSVPLKDREQLVKKNAEIHNRRRDRGYLEYVEYRPQVDAAITCLLTSQPDPQRGKKWPADPAALQAWASSIRGGRPVVLADELTTPPAGAHLEQVPAAAGNVYYMRWVRIYQHLRDHPEYRMVWCTDGSDVLMLREPWAEMEPGKVYVGSEPKTYDDEWAVKNHPARIFQDFITTHRRDPMVNAGLLGGTRADVMGFAHAIIRTYYDLQAERFWKTEKAPAEVGDMIAFGIVAYSDEYRDRVVTGPGVHTLFRAEEKTPYAWWKHR